MVRFVLTVVALSLGSVPLAHAAWDPGGNTPPNATATNQAAGVHEPIEGTDTTRESLIRATGNGGGM